MNRKPTWYEKMIMDGVDSEIGPGGLTTPEPEPNDQTSSQDNQED